MNLISILHEESHEKEWEHNLAIETEDQIEYMPVGRNIIGLSKVTTDIGQSNKGLHGSLESLNVKFIYK